MIHITVLARSTLNMQSLNIKLCSNVCWYVCPSCLYVLYYFPFTASRLLRLFGKLLSGTLLLPTSAMLCSPLKRTLEGPTSTFMDWFPPFWYWWYTSCMYDKMPERQHAGDPIVLGSRQLNNLIRMCSGGVLWHSYAPVTPISPWCDLPARNSFIIMDMQKTAS